MSRALCIVALGLCYHLAITIGAIAVAIVRGRWRHADAAAVRAVAFPAMQFRRRWRVPWVLCAAAMLAWLFALGILAAITKLPGWPWVG